MICKEKENGQRCEKWRTNFCITPPQSVLNSWSFPFRLKNGRRFGHSWQLLWHNLGCNIFAPSCRMSASLQLLHSGRTWLKRNQWRIEYEAAVENKNEKTQSLGSSYKLPSWKDTKRDLEPQTARRTMEYFYRLEEHLRVNRELVSPSFGNTGVFPFEVNSWSRRSLYSYRCSASHSSKPLLRLTARLLHMKVLQLKDSWGLEGFRDGSDYRRAFNTRPTPPKKELDIRTDERRQQLLELGGNGKLTTDLSLVHAWNSPRPSLRMGILSASESPAKAIGPLSFTWSPRPCESSPELASYSYASDELSSPRWISPRFADVVPNDWSALWWVAPSGWAYMTGFGELSYTSVGVPCRSSTKDFRESLTIIQVHFNCGSICNKTLKAGQVLDYR
jgi:hypothetical protein